MTPFESPESMGDRLAAAYCGEDATEADEEAAARAQNRDELLTVAIAARDAYLVARIAAALEPAGPDDTAHDPIERVREVLREAGWPMADRSEVVPGEARTEELLPADGGTFADLVRRLGKAKDRLRRPLVVTGPATVRADVAPQGGHRGR